MSSIMRVRRSESPFSKTIERLQVGLDPHQAVLRQVEVLKRRHVVHHHVVDGVDVGVVAGKENLFGGQTSADLVPALDERHLRPALAR